ncbi:MAG TPA: DUF177 domain-containing protein [Candidatus Omnitrophota bacterium]|nr:DUF177 domain-containing protein [Candidatus Omnitrophota bacterium]HPT06578.1 DUF177 domain-containing protein [Candidatus Omnitrophota bacterium]
MKIRLSQIAFDGSEFNDSIDPKTLDLDTDVIHFLGPLAVKAEVSRITNAVLVKVLLTGKVELICSRCLQPIKTDLHKEVALTYMVEPRDLSLDLDPDIREELILDYSINPLCSATCKGLCPRCGKNLNEGGCTCAITKTKTF